MKRFSLVAIAALLGLAAIHPSLKADEYDRKTVISISQPLEVPGVVLPPGTYVMKLLNSSSNRHIVQFMNADQNHQLALTFAVPAERIRPTEKTLLTMYEGTAGSPPALRTWYYPGDTVGHEFLYPHRQAVRISERTNTVVPEAEGGQNTSASANTAEPVQDAAESVQSAGPSHETLIARAEPAPEPLPAPEPQQPAAVTPAPAPNPAPSPEAAPAADQTAPGAIAESLPKTAGNGPLAALIGGLSLALAFGIRKIGRSRVR